MATVSQQTRATRVEQARAHPLFERDDVAVAGSGAGAGAGAGAVTLAVVKIVADKVAGITVCRAAADATIPEIAKAASTGGALGAAERLSVGRVSHAAGRPPRQVPWGLGRKIEVIVFATAEADRADSVTAVYVETLSSAQLAAERDAARAEEDRAAADQKLEKLLAEQREAAEARRAAAALAAFAAAATPTASARQGLW